MIHHANRARLLTLEQRFNNKIIDQPKAVAAVTQVITNVVAGFFETRSPLSVLFFAGPTGVGKTEMAKLIADEVGWPLHRFDMSEFSERHKISSFIGSPPGYVGFDQGGSLTRVLKKTPCVVLFDEIEKAHRDSTRLFLQLFDEGRITSSKGDLVVAKHAFFIMTSNLGSELFGKGLSSEELQRGLALKIKEHFSPEFLGRIHKVVVFNPLTDSSVKRIGRNYFKTLVAEIEQSAKLAIRYEEPIIERLANANFDLSAGARGIQLHIKDIFTAALSKAYLNGTFDNGSAIVLSTSADNGICIKKCSDYYILLDQRLRSTNELVGKWAVYLENYPQAELITKVEDRFVSLVTQYGIGEAIRPGKWILPDPTIDAHAFFQNICFDMADAVKKDRCTLLISEIFLRSKIKTLSLPQPLEDLYQKVEGNAEVAPLVDELQKLMGKILVKVHNPFQYDEDKIAFARSYSSDSTIVNNSITAKTQNENYVFPFGDDPKEEDPL